MGSIDQFLWTKLFRWYCLLMLFWLGAWNIRLYLGTQIHFSAWGEVAFWLVWKLLIWWLLTWILLKPQQSLQKLLTENTRQGILWALGTGGFLLMLNLILVSTLRLPWHVPSITAGLVSAVVLTPFLEEFVFRGAVLPYLVERTHSFWKSNLVTTALFLGLHLPGWYFQGSFQSPMIVVTMISITLLSLLFGWVTHRSKSLWSAILLHAINNFLASMLY